MKRILAAVLLLTCLAGTAFAEDMSEVRGYLKDADSVYQYLYMGTYPYEEDGTEAPLLWRILGRDGDVITCFTEYIIDTHQVMEIENYKDAIKKHKFNRTTVYEETDLFAWVNGEMTDTILKQDDFRAAIVEADGGLFHIMDYMEMKRKEFGFPNSRYGNTKENPWEKIEPNAKYRKAYGTPYAKEKVIYPEWAKETKKYKLIQYKQYGNSAPYWTTDQRPTLGGIVGANGHLSVHGKADVQVGVRPAMLLDLTKLRITGGQGTLEDPWRMEVTAGENAASAPAEETGGTGEAGE
jgi:hypothetical protein